MSTEVRGDCTVGAAIVTNGAVAYAPGKDLDKKAKEKALSMMPSIEKQFRMIGMVITAETVAELTADLRDETRRSFDWLITQVNNIERLAEKELKNKLFLYVPPERAKFWPTKDAPYAFGEKVAQVFAAAVGDIDAASRCFALEESDACVFHLMRALGPALQTLADRLEVIFPSPLDLENWKNIVDKIDAEITKQVKALEQTHKTHERNAELKELAELATQIRHFKNAWRNDAAHGRKHYDTREAELVYGAVKEFMQAMADAA